MLPEPFGGYEHELRGELYINQRVAQIEPRAKDWSLRNYCYGIVNPIRKDKSPDLKYVEFVGYELTLKDGLMGGPISQVALLNYLRDNCPNIIPQEIVTLHKLCDEYKTVAEYYDLYLRKYRDEWDFETDGIVLTVDNRCNHKDIDKTRGGATRYHHFNIAIKPPARSKETKLLDIVWEVSKHGKIIPTGVLEPVEIGSAEFTSVTLNNAATVIELGLCKGSSILLERANDVIPKIVKVIENTGPTIELPKICPACKSPLIREDKHLRCTNKNCQGRHIALIFHWITTNNIKNVGRRTVEDLYSTGAVQTIADLYTTDIDSVLSILPGYTSGGSKVEKINDAIQGTKGMSERIMISRIGIPSIGDATTEKYKLYKIEDVLKYKHDATYKYEAEKEIHDWISDPQNEELLVSLKRILGSQPYIASVVQKNGITFSITGSFPQDREVIIADLESKGFTYHASVSNKTNVLLKGEGSESTTKYKKALALGISIVGSPEELTK